VVGGNVALLPVLIITQIIVLLDIIIQALLPVPQAIHRPALRPPEVHPAVAIQYAANVLVEQILVGLRPVEIYTDVLEQMSAMDWEQEQETA